MGLSNWQRGAEAVLALEGARRWRVAEQGWMMLAKAAPDHEMWLLAHARGEMCHVWASAPASPVHACTGDICKTVGCQYGKPDIYPHLKRLKEDSERSWR
jgi:hypothetical protein